MTPRIWTGAALIAALLSLLNRPGLTPARPAGQDPSPWEARLEALRPTDPQGYFLLAEEIADAASNEAEFDLSRRLFGLAGALAPDRFGRSSALALADLETRDDRKRRLLATAQLLGHFDFTDAVLDDASPGAVDPATAAAVAEAINYYRQGRGERVLRSLEPYGLEAALQPFAHVIGDPRRFLENARVYQRGTAGSPVRTEEERRRLLELELALLTGTASSWQADLTLQSGRTLLELDPTDLSATFQVDAARSWYRDGAWWESNPFNGTSDPDV